MAKTRYHVYTSKVELQKKKYKNTLNNVVQDFHIKVIELQKKSIQKIIITLCMSTQIYIFKIISDSSKDYE